MSNYYNRAKSEYMTVSAIRMAAKGYVSAMDNLHCALVGAVLLALTGQCSALTALYQSAGWIGPKTRGRDGKERHLIAPMGVQAWAYITHGLGLGRDGEFITPVIHLDRDNGKWAMGGERKADPKWKAALTMRTLESVYEGFETRFDQWGAEKAPSTSALDVNASMDKMIARVRRAERKGLDVEMDLVKLAEQTKHLVELVNRVREGRANANMTANTRGLQYQAA